MANHSYRNRRRPPETLQPTTTEPAVRRWPHPIPQPYAPAPAEASLHYIHCALSYQNEMLGEIKTLLEELVTAQADSLEK